MSDTAHTAPRPSPPRIGALLTGVRGRARVWLGLFPLSGVGLFVLVGSLVAFLHYGLRRIDLILLVVGLVGLFLVATALVVTVVATLLVVRQARHLESEDDVGVECGSAARTGFSLPNFWYLPLVDVRWSWVSPEAQARVVVRQGRLHEEVVASRRGTVDRIVRRFDVGDVFGLSRMNFELTERRKVRFLPSMGALERVEVIRGMSGGDDLAHPDGPPEGDPVDMRHYNPGDPIKFVLWKVFARSRKLVVRTPERAISPARQTAAFVVTGAGDEPAAGAARVAVKRGSLGTDWRLGADGVNEVATTRGQALEVLTASGHAPDAASGQGLAPFLERAGLGDVGRAVVFVPARPGPWIDRVLEACTARRGRVEFVACADGIVAEQTTSWWRRALVGEELAAPPPGQVAAATQAELQEVVQRLSGARSRVTIVDRTTGRVFTSAHLQNPGERAA